MAFQDPDWNSVRQRLARATFQVHLADGRGGRRCGTGFFVSPTVALTAYHTLEGMPPAERGAIRGRFGVEAAPGFSCPTFLWDEEASSRLHDIAVLRLVEPKGEYEHYLPAAALPVDLSEEQAERFWYARRMTVFGYP